MPDLVFFAVCIVGVFILAMRRAPLWAWTVGLAAAAYVWQSGMLYGEASELTIETDSVGSATNPACELRLTMRP